MNPVTNSTFVKVFNVYNAVGGGTRSSYTFVQNWINSIMEQPFSTGRGGWENRVGDSKKIYNPPLHTKKINPSLWASKKNHILPP